MTAKPLGWLRGNLKTPPVGQEARREAGALLRRLQDGEQLSPPESRPMPSIGPRAHELRVQDAESRLTWRIFYRIDPDAILVIEWFERRLRRRRRRSSALAREASRVRRSGEASKEGEGLMNAKKRKALEEAGCQFGDVQDLLELSDADMAIVEARANLARALRKMRKRLRVSQEELAARIGSSQSRVSSAESGQGTVEQIIRCLVALGADRKKIGREIAA